MENYTENGFLQIKSLVDEDNYDIMNPEVHRNEDLKHLLQSIGQSLEINWADWFFRIMLEYVFENEEIADESSCSIKDIVEIEQEVRSIMETQDHWNPKIVLCLLTVMAKYIDNAKDTYNQCHKVEKTVTNSDEDFFFIL